MSRVLLTVGLPTLVEELLQFPDADVLVQGALHPNKSRAMYTEVYKCLQMSRQNRLFLDAIWRLFEQSFTNSD